MLADNTTVVTALGKHVRKLPQELRRSCTNEITNGLLRQYFPRGADLSRFSQSHLNKVAVRLNQRPRKTLGSHPEGMLSAFEIDSKLAKTSRQVWILQKDAGRSFMRRARGYNDRC